MFGSIASIAIVSRSFEHVVAQLEVCNHGFASLTRALRFRAWEAAGERCPAARPTDESRLIIDLDATLVSSHSKKE